MTTNIWRIVWRNAKTGNVEYTGLSKFNSWSDADSALSTLLGFRRNGLTPTIERELTEVA